MRRRKGLFTYLLKAYINEVFPDQSVLRVSDLNDDIIGFWTNNLDDSSGLHDLLGWSYRFNEDGTGIHYCWHSGQLEDTISFMWEPVNANTIRARYAEDEEWMNIEYTIQTFDIPYKRPLIKLTDNNYVANETSKEGFGAGHGALFKINSTNLNLQMTHIRSHSGPHIFNI